MHPSGTQPGPGCGCPSDATRLEMVGDKPLTLLSAQAPGSRCRCLTRAQGLWPPREVSPGTSRPGAIPGSDAGGCAGPQMGAPSLRALGKEMPLPAVGGGDGVSRVGGHPREHATLLVRHPTAPSPVPSRSPLCRGAARDAVGPTQSPTRSFCKARKWENDEVGDILTAPALRSLAPPPALPKSFPAGPHPDPEWGAPRDAWHSQPHWDREELQQGDTAAAASTGDPQHPRAAALTSCSAHELQHPQHPQHPSPL